MTPSQKQRLEEIRKRVNSRPGEETFEPVYLYKVTFEDSNYLLSLIDELEARVKEMEGRRAHRNDYCLCGHTREQHIYEEGACRPGIICEMKCEQFTLPNPKEPRG